VGIRHNTTSAVTAALVVALAMASTSAHEFIVRPDRMEAAPGSTMPLQVFSAHTFFAKSEELEPANEIEASVVAGSKRTPVALTANAQTLAYVGAATAPIPGGPFVISGHRQPQIWATTPQGFRNVGEPALA
jgi:hypothetical protein